MGEPGRRMNQIKIIAKIISTNNKLTVFPSGAFSHLALISLPRTLPN
jgi:hypothetical protein